MSSMGEEKMNSQGKAHSNIVHDNSSNTTSYGEENRSSHMAEADSDSEKKKQRKPRKPPAVNWKKPKGMPKRPLSAYNLFFKVQREAIMSARAKDTSEAAAKRSKKETVGIGFANLARTIADKWQALDNADKAEYLEQAAKEKARYKQEMVVWRKKQKEEKERQASMPPPTVTGMPTQQNMAMVGGMLTAAGRNLYDESRIHPALYWQGAGLQNPHQQQASNILFGMHHHQPQQQQSSMMMQSYLMQELSDNTLLQRQQLQRQQQHLQELQARHQLLLSGSLDHSSSSAAAAPASRQTPNNGPTDVTAASYPDTWFELQQQSSQRQANNNMQTMNHHHHHQDQHSTSPFQEDGELRKLNPGNKNFGWQQAQLLQDQHLQEQLHGGQHLHGVDVGMLKDHGVGKKPADDVHQQPLKQAPEAALMGSSAAVGVGRGDRSSPSFHNLASKLDNDAISFLTEFRFNGNNHNNSNSSNSGESTN